jgi:hypothetical protein
MPDTGEDREIKQRVNAKEAVRVAQSKNLLQKTKKDNAIGRPRGKNAKARKPGAR